MQLIGGIARNKGFLIALAIAAWLGLEVGGKGSGVVRWLLSPGATREDGFHPLDLIGARVKGPVRLSRADAEAVEARIKNAFGENAPMYQRSAAMRHLYELKKGARCPRDFSDLSECNKVERLETYFAAVLRAMHPGTEHLIWVEHNSYASGPGRSLAIQVIVFVGVDEKIKFAFDLRRVKRIAGLSGFTIRTYDQSGLRNLQTEDVSSGVLIVDDPGALRMPEGRVGSILVHGGTNPPADAIMSLPLDGGLAVRHRLFSAVLGKPIKGV